MARWSVWVWNELFKRSFLKKKIKILTCGKFFLTDCIFGGFFKTTYEKNTVPKLLSTRITNAKFHSDYHREHILYRRQLWTWAKTSSKNVEKTSSNTEACFGRIKTFLVLKRQLFHSGLPHMNSNQHGKVCQSKHLKICDTLIYGLPIYSTCFSHQNSSYHLIISKVTLILEVT